VYFLVSLYCIYTSDLVARHVDVVHVGQAENQDSSPPLYLQHGLLENQHRQHAHNDGGIGDVHSGHRQVTCAVDTRVGAGYYAHDATDEVGMARENGKGADVARAQTVELDVLL